MAASGNTSDGCTFVSVIVPVYNGADIIGDCIESLLSQAYPQDRYEIIIVDNDSTDGTAEVIKGYPVKYVMEDQIHTPYGARNTGARHARGDLLAFCDADQVADKRWLGALVDALGDGYAGVAGATVPMAEADSLVAQFAAADTTVQPSAEARDTDRAGAGNVLYRRSAFELLGGFAAETPTLGDFDLSIRAVRDFGMAIMYTPDAIQYHRLRTTLGQLLRHEARFGFAAEWLTARKRMSFPSLGGLGLRLAKSTSAALVTALRAPFDKKVRQSRKLATILLGILMTAANAYGRLLYRTRRKLPRNW